MMPELKFRSSNDLPGRFGLTVPVPDGWTLVSVAEYPSRTDYTFAVQLIRTVRLANTEPTLDDFIAIKRGTGFSADEALRDFIARYLN